MRIRNLILSAAVLMATPALMYAQSSSINSFSPYTFYGLGDLSVQGATFLRGMGGASTAYRAPGTINFNNPASMSSMPRKTFLFNVGLDGGTNYLKSGDKKSAFTTFNVREVAIQFPLYNKLAFGVSLTPYSSVGYRTKIEETDPDVLASLWQGGASGAFYRYEGEGDVNQAKASIGWEPLKNLSIGVDMIYYFGSINRSFDTDILTNSSSNGFINSYITQKEDISRIMWNFGAQYNIISTSRHILTAGATFQPGGKLNPDISIQALNATGNAQALRNGLAENFEMPNTLSLGLYFHNPRLSAGIDYTFQNWGEINSDSEFSPSGDGTVSMKFRNTNSFKAGMEYTPNLYDSRRLMRRFTYRAGFRYSDYYMNFNDTNISDMAITLGIGIPVRIMTSELGSHSYIDIGLDLGRRGTTSNNLISENYFRISVGLRLFGNDGWFRKLQYK